MSSITAPTAVSSLLAPSPGAAGGSELHALGHVTVAFLLLGIYGIQVCPFIETLSPLALLWPNALAGVVRARVHVHICEAILRREQIIAITNAIQYACPGETSGIHVDGKWCIHLTRKGLGVHGAQGRRARSSA